MTDIRLCSFIILSIEVTSCSTVSVKRLIQGIRYFEDNEISFWISVDSEFFTSTSYFFNTPSEEVVQCLEGAVLDYLTFDQVRYAIKKFEDFKDFNIKNMELYYKYAQMRSVLSRIPLAKKRVTYFLKNYNSKIIERTPDKVIASFLNIKPETYSRLKKAKP